MRLRLVLVCLVLLAATPVMAQWDSNEDAGCGAQISGDDCMNPDPDEAANWNAPGIQTCTTNQSCLSCEYVPALLRGDCVYLSRKNGACQCETKQSPGEYTCTVKGTCKYQA